MFCIFFKKTWLLRYFKQGVTFDNKKFKSNCLFPLLSAQNKQKLTLGYENYQNSL